jgi:methyl-accepting chemotaxis protein
MWAKLQQTISTQPTSVLALVTAAVFVGVAILRLDGLWWLFSAVYLVGGILLWQRVPAVVAISPTKSDATLSKRPAMLQKAVPANGAVAEDALSTKLNVTVDGLVRATFAMNSVTQQQSTSAEEQASVIKLANHKLDDFLNLAERISLKARSVTQTAEQAAETSRSGEDAIREAIQSMADIRQQVQAIGGTIAKLALLTRRIDEIITSVSEIATQSNLLALNASIEAARAGVHGRGFAVVADEVRSLAQQSTQAATQVRSILIEIQKAMKDTVQATQLGVQNAEDGVERTREAQEVMQQLSSSVQSARDAMREVSQVIQHQANGMEEIAISIERVERLIGQSLASTRTVETVSANLTRLAQDLQTAVGIPVTNSPLQPATP